MAAPSSSANVAASVSFAPTDTVESIELNGKTYYLAAPALAPSPASADFAGTAMAAPFSEEMNTTFAYHSFEAFAAINGPSHASLDWLSHTCSPVGIDTTPEPVAYSTSRASVDSLDESPFILDTGTTCHLSPIKSDFKSLHPITPHPITSIGGARVHATGVSSIELCIASNHKVMLKDVLFILMLTICLVSVLCFNRSSSYISSFNSSSCWVTNKAGATVL
jgi:hypothetical protein